MLARSCKHLSFSRVFLGLDIEDAQGNRKPLPMDAVKWFKQLGSWREDTGPYKTLKFLKR